VTASDVLAVKDMPEDITHCIRILPPLLPSGSTTYRGAGGLHGQGKGKYIYVVFGAVIGCPFDLFPDQYYYMGTFTILLLFEIVLGPSVAWLQPHLPTAKGAFCIDL
jgi:hypothetical protein